MGRSPLAPVRASLLRTFRLLLPTSHSKRLRAAPAFALATSWPGSGFCGRRNSAWIPQHVGPALRPVGSVAPFALLLRRTRRRRRFRLQLRCRSTGFASPSAAGRSLALATTLLGTRPPIGCHGRRRRASLPPSCAGGVLTRVVHFDVLFAQPQPDGPGAPDRVVDESVTGCPRARKGHLRASACCTARQRGPASARNGVTRLAPQSEPPLAAVWHLTTVIPQSSTGDKTFCKSLLIPSEPAAISPSHRGADSSRSVYWGIG